jgi:hypothetical protein
MGHWAWNETSRLNIFTVADCLGVHVLDGPRGLYLSYASTAAGLLNYLHTAVTHKAFDFLGFLTAGMWYWDWSEEAGKLGCAYHNVF